MNANLYFAILVALSDPSPYPVRLARADDGRLYASRVESRADYADETLAWAATPDEAVAALRGLNLHAW